MNLTYMPKKPKSLKIAVFGLLAQVGGQDPPRCLLTSPPQTPSGAGEKRGGIRVRKFMGQNHEARKTLDARKTDLTWGRPCNTPTHRYQQLANSRLCATECLSIGSLQQHE